MKILVLCPPDFKRSPLVRKLRHRTMVPVRDLDTEVLDRNGGIWPGHYPKVVKQLEERVIASVRDTPALILTAGSPSHDLLTLAVQAGFKIHCVRTSVTSEYIDELTNEGFAPRVIDGTKSSEAVVEALTK